jgi:hypothetical protein
VGVIVVALATLVSDARADKKSPGLFDFGGWKLPVTREREAAQRLAPVPFDITPLGPPRAAPRAMRVRVYADRDYRAGVMHWQGKVRAQLDHVNHVVAPLFGVTFEIESLRDWDRSHAGVALQPVLEELGKLDASTDVDWVIGLTTPFRGVATSAHDIGMAWTSSRIFVLRAMDDAQEARALAEAFEMLSEGEREKLYADRKVHKELEIFLHEWAHALGALHHEDEASIMNPRYSPHASSFTPFEKKLMGLALDKRLADRGQPFPENAELLKLIESAPREEGSDAERAELARFLRERGAGGHPKVTSSGAGGASGSVATPPPPELAQAFARLEASDVSGATPLVAAAARKIAAGAPSPGTLVRLAAAAAAVGALTTADAALARAGRAAPHAAELAEDLALERARDALPVAAAKQGIAPDDEPRYVALYLAAIHAVASMNRAAARAGVDALAKAFPDSAGREIAACELATAEGKGTEARARCDAALAKAPDALRAHLALARLDAKAKQWPAAEKHLRRVTLLDPKDPEAWRMLGRLYGDSGDSIKRDALARQYEALFGAPLPR